MQFPKSIKLGVIPYEVISVRRPIIDLETREVCDGDIQYFKQQIRLEVKGVGLQRQQATLMHEVIHGIQHSRNFKFDENRELVTDELAVGVLSFIKDNPDTIKWLQKH